MSKTPNRTTKRTGSSGLSSVPHNTTMPTTAIKQSPITKTVLDINTFTEVTLTKNVPDFIPAEDTTEVLARIGNDSAKMLELLNAGLKSAEREAVEKDSTIPFLCPALDDEGEETETLVPFTGIAANKDKVNALVLTLAKTAIDPPLQKGMTKEEKRATKQAAMDLIKTTPTIKAGLQKSAAM